METKRPRRLDLDKLAVAAQEHTSDRGAVRKFLDQIDPFVRCVSARTVARHRSRNRAVDVEDLVQEVLTKVWASLRNFNPAKGKFSTWVGTITYRAWIDLAFASDQGLDVVELDEGQPDGCSPVDEQVNARRSLARIEATLPRAAFELVMMNCAGQSAQDIASAGGINVDTVKTRLQVARKRAVAIVDCVAA